MSIVDTSRMRVRGPLLPFMQGFADELHRQGYKPDGARNQLRLMRQLSGWLEDEGLGTDDLVPVNLERFLDALRAADPRHRSSDRRVAQLVAHLREVGAAPPPPPEPAPEGAVEELLARYRTYAVRALDRGDIDRGAGALVVRGAKFGKSRELPLDPSTLEALRRYLRRGDRPRPAQGTEAVFVSMAGTRLLYTNVQPAFARLRDRAGIAPRSASCRPRLHDLRHSFAVRTILDAYRDGGEVEPRLAALSTYLGHVDPAKTYWYLEAAPELMALAADRLERHLGGGR